MAILAIFVNEFNGPQIWVEEMDYSYYVLHLDSDPSEFHEPVADKWIMVQSGSPLFNALRQQHHSQG